MSFIVKSNTGVSEKDRLASIHCEKIEKANEASNTHEDDADENKPTDDDEAAEDDIS